MEMGVLARMMLVSVEKFHKRRQVMFKQFRFISKIVLSLRSVNHEFTRFEKEHYPWSD